MSTPYDTYSTAYVHTMWNINTDKSCGIAMYILWLLRAAAVDGVVRPAEALCCWAVSGVVSIVGRIRKNVVHFS